MEKVSNCVFFFFFISCCWRRTLDVLTSIRTTTNLKFGFSVTWKIKFFKYFCIFEKTPRVIICLKLLNFFFAFLCIGRHLISAMNEFLASYYIEMKTPKYCLVFLYCFFVSIQFEWDILLVNIIIEIPMGSSKKKCIHQQVVRCWWSYYTAHTRLVWKTSGLNINFNQHSFNSKEKRLFFFSF
jgi:hypothetical protein